MSCRLGLLFLVLMSSVLITTATTARSNDGVLGKIKAGLQSASNYLETAKDIADLVSKSLRPKEDKKEKIRKSDSNVNNLPKTMGLDMFISWFFRLLGLDSQKVAAMAVNSVLYLAQMISSLFELAPSLEQGRMSENDDQPLFNPLKYILDNKNERIKNLVAQAQDSRLPYQLIDKIDGLDTSCVRLLLCKTSPIIWAAQNSLKNHTHKKERDITTWLPTRTEFEDNSDLCEQRHMDCQIFPR